MQDLYNSDYNKKNTCNAAFLTTGLWALCLWCHAALEKKKEAFLEWEIKSRCATWAPRNQ